MRDFDCAACRIQHEAEMDDKPLEELAGRGLGRGHRMDATVDTGSAGIRGGHQKDEDGSGGDDDAAVYFW